MQYPDAPQLLSSKLLRFPVGHKYYSGQYGHWCPACEQLHMIASKEQPFSNGAGWTYDGNHNAPTFNPSVNYTWEKDDKGRWVNVCHYFIRTGGIDFCGDCTHQFKDKKAVPMPDIPQHVLGNWGLNGL